MSDCLILWMNILFYERLQNETHFAATGRATPLARTPHKKDDAMKWIHNGSPIDLNESEVATLAELAVLMDSGHTATVEGDGFYLARPMINPHLI